MLNRDIVIINNLELRDIRTVVSCKVDGQFQTDADAAIPSLCLGHIFELHYMSLQPKVNRREDASAETIPDRHLQSITATTSR